MATAQDEIRRWLAAAAKENATHLIVVCDTFDHNDYPVSVLPGQDVRTEYDKYDSKNMQRVMEVYALHLSIEDQLNERRAFHFEVKP